MEKKIILFCLIIVFCLTVSFRNIIRAQEEDIIKLRSPFASTTVEGVVNGLIDFIFQAAVLIAPLMVVVGGFLFATAGGQPEQLVKAKKLLSWTAIGFGIVLLARVIFEAVKAIFQG